MVEIPATPAGNRRGMGSRRRRSGQRWRSKYLATVVALKVRGDGGGTLPGGRQIAQLGGAGPWRRTGDGGGRRRGWRDLFVIVLKLRWLFYKIGNELRMRHVFRDGRSMMLSLWLGIVHHIILLMM